MRLIITLLTICIVLSITALMGCGGDDSPDTEIDEIAERTAFLVNDGSPWEASSDTFVMKDGYDVSDQFSGFTLDFKEDGTYTTSNSLNNAWPDQGIWSLDSNDKNKIIRGDGVEMRSTVSGSTLTLTFTASGTNGGRPESVDGEFQFSLISQ